MRILRMRPPLFLFCLIFGVSSALVAVSCGQVRPTNADILRSGFTELRANAEAVIADPNRRDAYLELSRRMESELLAFDDYADGFFDDYRQAFTDHATSQSVLSDQSEAFRRRQRAMQDRFVDHHLAMAATVTPHEWQLLSPHEAKIIERLLTAALGKSR